MNAKKIHTKEIIVGALILSLISFAGFSTLEPTNLLAIEDQFTVSVSVTSEIAFSVPATDVTLASIPGLTGGTSNGQTQVVVVTNDSAGYTMTLKASSSPAMQGHTQGGTIPNYTPTVAGVPDFNFSVPANRAEFGYSVEASTTADLVQSWRDNGTSACGTGALNTADRCWLDATTTNYVLINRNTFTPTSGSTTTLKFRLTINSNPSPLIPEDVYTATTTLTATTN